MLRLIGIKMFLDGGMLTGSAYMREPWGVSKIYSITDPKYRGVLLHPARQIEADHRAPPPNPGFNSRRTVGDGAVQHAAGCIRTRSTASFRRDRSSKPAPASRTATSFIPMPS